MTHKFRFCFVLAQVYTIVNESRYLLLFGVPRINLQQEVKQLFAKYGSVSKVKQVTEEMNLNSSGRF